MPLNSDKVLPVLGGTRLQTVVPTEYVLAAILNPMFSASVESCYDYSDKHLCVEILRLCKERFCYDSNEIDGTKDESGSVKISCSEDLSNIAGSMDDDWASHMRAAS